MKLLKALKRNPHTVVVWLSFGLFGFVYAFVFPTASLTTPDLRVAYACVGMAASVIAIIALFFAADLDGKD